MPTNLNGEIELRLKSIPFETFSNRVIYYDPMNTSAFSKYIEEHLEEIKGWFQKFNYEFCYIPDLCNQITEEQISYRIPNWKGETIRRVGNDLLKTYLAEGCDDIGAGFIRVTMLWDEIRFFPLIPFDQKAFVDQIKHYENYLQAKSSSYDHVMFSISEASEDNGLYEIYNKKFCRADDSFDWTSIDLEVINLIRGLHKEGVQEFVLRCMVPVKDKLSRVVITSQYDVVLPDYENKIIEMMPLPKAVFLLFLKHDEGIYFKELVDYRDELRTIYQKITNRKSTGVIEESIVNVTDPTQNAINEKCSRIREAFLKQIDESLAKSYFIQGKRGNPKRITLPRDLVEWQCEL